MRAPANPMAQMLSVDGGSPGLGRWAGWHPDEVVAVGAAVLPMLSLLFACLRLSCNVEGTTDNACIWTVTFGVCQCLVPEEDQKDQEGRKRTDPTSALEAGLAHGRQVTVDAPRKASSKPARTSTAGLARQASRNYLARSSVTGAAPALAANGFSDTRLVSA